MKTKSCLGPTQIRRYAVSVPGWSGAGYILFDPDTGSGAYKIRGGMNGGYMGILYATLFISSLYDGMAGAGAPALAFALGMLIAIVAVWELYGLMYGELVQRCFALGLAIGLIGAGFLTRIAGLPLKEGTGGVAALIALMVAVDMRNVEMAELHECGLNLD